MTHAMKPVPRRTALPAATLAALLLAGCSTGYIGETWQCPLAEGGSCGSVAAADPAVPERKAARATVLAEPLWRVRAAETGTSPAREPGQAAEPPCPADCDGGFDPFAWLARLFQAEGGGNADGAGQDDSAAAAAAAAGSAAAMRSSDAEPGEAAAASVAARTAEPASPALPAERDPAQGDPEAGDLHADALRTGEVVARIWIAPFVDANGVYREASHVRVVLEPAGWRLP